MLASQGLCSVELGSLFVSVMLAVSERTV